MHEQRQQQERDTRDLGYHSTGEHRLKARARELFRQGRYNEIVKIESQIASSEQQIFAIARRRSRGEMIAFHVLTGR